MALTTGRTYSSRLWNTLVNIMGSASILRHRSRYKLYKLGGLQIETTDIRPGCFFFSPKIKIGPGTMINHRCYFENREQINIGENCRIAMEVMFCTSSHLIGESKMRGGEYAGKPISVGNGCWIGTRAVILPGVTVGDGCVIAAGAVVTNDCEPNGLYAGIPAKKVKTLP